MGSLALKVPAAQAGHGTDLGPDVGEGTQEGSVAKEHDMEDIDRVEQVPGLQDGEPRSLTGSGSFADGPAGRGLVLAAPRPQAAAIRQICRDRAVYSAAYCTGLLSETRDFRNLLEAGCVLEAPSGLVDG